MLFNLFYVRSRLWRLGSVARTAQIFYDICTFGEVPVETVTGLIQSDKQKKKNKLEN